jgi:hypothetical protein
MLNPHTGGEDYANMPREATRSEGTNRIRLAQNGKK